MTTIGVLVTTQTIVVDPADQSVAVIAAGPIGPRGFQGATGAAGTTGPQGPQGIPGTPLTSQAINAQTIQTYTLALSDAEKLILMQNAGVSSVTIPNNSTAAFPIGTRIDIVRMGAGTLSVATAAGVTLNATPSPVLRAQYSGAGLIKWATNSWILVGDLT